MEKGQTILAILLLLSIISCFLPWLTAKVVIDGEDRSTTNYGYQYIIPLGVRYTAMPMAILNVIGFILSAISFKAIERIRTLNVIAGILIMIGVALAFAHTLSAAMTAATGASRGYSIFVSAEYGMGLEALFGFLMIIAGALVKPKIV
jgi:hypothetical protein